MATSVEFRLRGWSIIDNVHDQAPAAGNIFTQFLSAIVNFFQNIISSFDFDIRQLLDQIRHWLQVAAPYLLAVVILFLCIICVVYFFSCIVSLFRCLFAGIGFIMKGLFSGACAIFKFLMPCLAFGGRSAVKMMKAPGQAGVMIARGAFEAAPKAYFASLRMLG